MFGVGSVARPVHLSLETVLVVGGVVDSPQSSVGLLQLVVALDHITVTSLLLGLDVVGMRVVHGVLELVLRVVVLQGETWVSTDPQA